MFWLVAGPKAEKDLLLLLPKENSLNRSLILKKRTEISFLFENGEKIKTRLFSFFWKRSDAFKFGIFIKGKTTSAVNRNKIKRIYREAVRLNRQKLKSDFSIAITHVPQKTPPTFDEINVEISNIFEKLNQQL